MIVGYRCSMRRFSLPALVFTAAAMSAAAPAGAEGPAPGLFQEEAAIGNVAIR
jgi:hypothetical protein